MKAMGDKDDHNIMITATYLLEFPFPYETVHSIFGPRGPPDGVVGIKVDPCSSLFFRDKLQSVIVDKHIGGTALKFVRGDGLLD